MNISYLLKLLIAPILLFTTIPTQPINIKTATAVTATAALGYKGIQSYQRYQDFKKNLKWDWSAIGTDDGQTPNPHFTLKPDDLPNDFYFGAGNAAIQSEGGITNSTYNHPKFAAKYPELQTTGNDSWHRWDQDLQLIKDLKLNSYRISMEWSRVQPTAHTFDKEALDEYARRYIQLIEIGVTPVLGFHHYSDPQWFMYPDGNADNPVGFASKENAQKFVTYARTAYWHIYQSYKDTLAAKTPEEQKRFLTAPVYSFNSPNAYALNGYHLGERPPAVKDMQQAVNVYENMLMAHNEMYRAIKKINSQAQIGITMNIYPLDPIATPKNPLKWGLSYLGSWFGNWLSNSAGLNFFIDNKLTLLIPGKATKNMRPLALLKTLANRYTFNKKNKTLDFIGVNYYCHGYMNGFTPSVPQDELKTSLPRYTIYAEGLYRAIKEVSERVAQPLGIPIYVTENGFSENDITNDDGTPIDGDERRKLFLNRHMHALSRAYKDGYPIAGSNYWCLYDNVEWTEGYKKSFGLADRERNVKESGRHYARLIAPFTNQ